jgi:peroxiredoxin Q/BCP
LFIKVKKKDPQVPSVKLQIYARSWPIGVPKTEHLNYSPGCTEEACYFRDQFEVFNDANAKIIGISGQSVESHKKFAEKYKLSYTLLSDEGNKIRNLFGVPTNFLGLLPGRVTYVIDKSGKVVYIFDSQTQTKRHVDNALKILKGLK